MTVLSIDLAYKNYCDIGIVLLGHMGDAIRCEPIRLNRNDVPSPPIVAALLHDICLQNASRVLVLDGPQGWKADDNGLLHSRLCERELNTPAKTGKPFEVKPAAYTKFVQFSIEVFDALCSLGWKRVSDPKTSSKSTERVLIESFPLSAWRELCLKTPPSKRKCQGKNLSVYIDALKPLFPLQLKEEMSHDEIQATVAGLAGLAVESGEWNSCKWAGAAPSFVNGHWREGLIANRALPSNTRIGSTN
jgi:hypothetical protein